MMTTYIPHTIGKVYDIAHLRPFDLELAKAGHPLAMASGEEVSHLFGSGIYISWELPRADWVVGGLSNFEFTAARLRLAPIAIKHDQRTGKDEPLHVGDVIEIKGSPNYGEPWLPHIVGAGSLIGSSNVAWRWPAEVQG